MRRHPLRVGVGPVVFLLATLLSSFLLVPERAATAATTAPELVGGVTPEEAMRLGEKMYREGLLPSGKPMQATVKGDVPVDGRMFTCVSCHLRSGFGTSEGQIRTPPIDGTRLYSPVSKFRGVPLVGQATGIKGEELLRPAYTDKTLAEVMEGGVDPANRQLNSIMPLYPLGEQEMAIMVHYLKNLSVGPQPGVTETTLRFATVITDEVAKEDREAMLTPLQNYIKNWRVPRVMERTIRSQSQRQEGGASRGLRTLALSVWELKGDPATWQQQLQAYYQKEPVFALLGGISTREWAPIHRFCEEMRIPSIFPVTDFPVISESGWYTVYLSKGLHQEGESAARYLHAREDLAADQAIVQVYRDGPAGTALAKAFRETWQELGHQAGDDLVVAADEPVPSDLWARIDRMHNKAVVLLWLNDRDFPDLALLAGDQPRPALVMASSDLLGQKVNALPESARGYLYLTYPYALPDEGRVYQLHPEIADVYDKGRVSQRLPTLKMYSLFQTISGALSRLRTFVYRDYLLELIEESPDLASGQIIYSNLSFGQGQRYASKGCYVVQLGPGAQPGFIKRSEWVIH